MFTLLALEVLAVCNLVSDVVAKFIITTVAQRTLWLLIAFAPLVPDACSVPIGILAFRNPWHTRHDTYREQKQAGAARAPHTPPVQNTLLLHRARHLHLQPRRGGLGRDIQNILTLKFRDADFPNS
jgi:hypothetical protein